MKTAEILIDAFKISLVDLLRTISEEPSYKPLEALIVHEDPSGNSSDIGFSGLLKELVSV